MKNEDRFLEELIGRKNNPFLVPEGYFEETPSNIMKRIDAFEAKNRTRLTRRFRRYVAIAAAVVGIVFVSSALLFYTQDTHEIADLEKQHENYVNDALDYAMVSNEEVYFYMTEQTK